MTVKRFVVANTVEERLLSVRRALWVDRAETSTNVCGTGDVADDEQHITVAKKKKKGKNVDVTTNVSSKRIELLERVIGTMEVEKA